MNAIQTVTRAFDYESQVKSIILRYSSHWFYIGITTLKDGDTPENAAQKRAKKDKRFTPSPVEVYVLDSGIHITGQTEREAISICKDTLSRYGKPDRLVNNSNGGEGKHIGKQVIYMRIFDTRPEYKPVTKNKNKKTNNNTIVHKHPIEKNTKNNCIPCNIL